LLITVVSLFFFLDMDSCCTDSAVGITAGLKPIMAETMIREAGPRLALFRHCPEQIRVPVNQVANCFTVAVYRRVSENNIPRINIHLHVCNVQRCTDSQGCQQEKAVIVIPCSSTPPQRKKVELENQVTATRHLDQTHLPNNGPNLTCVSSMCGLKRLTLGATLHC
jgi:hypothetical protein